jgi:uncharacterized protein YndB with AHSA1/START domain
MPICEIEFRVGGNWRYVWAMPEGQMEACGTYREIQHEKEIVHTENADWLDHESLITTSFIQEDEQTMVRMRIAYDSKASWTLPAVVRISVLRDAEEMLTNERV